MKACFSIFLFFLLPVALTAHCVSRPKNKFRVVLDPGHGGRDSATRFDGFYEKDVVLHIALEIKKQLEEKEVEVLMTRETDQFVTLDERAATAGEVFISLHANSVPDSIGPSVRSMIRGIEIYIDGRMSSPERVQKSEVFASLIYKNLLRLQDMRLRSAVRRKPLAVLKNNRSPAVLVELGFLTNPEDLAFLTTASCYKKMAAAFCDAVIAYRDRKEAVKKL